MSVKGDESVNETMSESVRGVVAKVAGRVIESTIVGIARACERWMKDSGQRMSIKRETAQKGEGLTQMSHARAREAAPSHARRTSLR